MREPLLLRGAIRDYSWGGRELIPRLLGIENREGRPFAELWFGAHPSAPSMVETADGPAPLDQWIAAAPERVLGPDCAARYRGRLPFLLKILDARRMLSIQAHPPRRQAEEGFERECRAGAHVNYVDPYHKPEVHVALTGMWMLHGLRPGAGDQYARLMRMPQPEVDALLEPLIARLEREQPADKSTHDYWALRAAREFPRDRGILALYLLNLIHLEPGQGTYQAPGVLHAYLEGATVELMANSDNVLRGGLTTKRVDAEELLRCVSLESGPPEVLHGSRVSEIETVYRTPAEEFELSRIELAGAARFAASGPEILVVLEGSVVPDSGMRVPCGGALLAPHGASYELSAERAVLFKAALPKSTAP